MLNRITDLFRNRRNKKKDGPSAEDIERVRRNFEASLHKKRPARRSRRVAHLETKGAFGQPSWKRWGYDFAGPQRD